MRRSTRIPLPRPFNVAKTLSFLRTSSLRTPYLFPSVRRLGRLVDVDDHPVAIDFHFPETTHEVRISSLAPHGRTARGRDVAPPPSKLRGIATGIWGLDDDLPRCYALLKRDPLLAPVVGHYTGIRLVRAPSLYEALVVAVIGQQLSVIAAEAIRRRLILALGECIEVDGLAYRGYPSPARLLATAASRLRAVGMSQMKVHYLREIAARAAAGELNHSHFAGIDDEDCIRQLAEIPGVGRWTAEISLIGGPGQNRCVPRRRLGTCGRGTAAHAIARSAYGAPAAHVGRTLEGLAQLRRLLFMEDPVKGPLDRAAFRRNVPCEGTIQRATVDRRRFQGVSGPGRSLRPLPTRTAQNLVQPHPC